MIRLLLRFLDAWRRKNLHDESLPEQGLLPWWVERTGSSKYRPFYENTTAKQVDQNSKLSLFGTPHERTPER